MCKLNNLHKGLLSLMPFFLLSMSPTHPDMNDADLDINNDGEVNILVLGTNSSINGTQAFSPNQIAVELQSILDADPAVTLDVNVAAEDIHMSKPILFGLGGNGTEYTANYHSHSLTQYYYWPEGLADRMDNLSGNGPVDWDFVVISADPYIIAKLPGYYSLGVKKVAAKVIEGGAQPLLLMPWFSNSAYGATIEHFEEFTYRTADGAKVPLPVIPAALAWDALPANKKDNASAQPTPNGAYLTAATLYSHICGSNASTSGYTYDDEIADVALATVVNEENEVHYTGPRTFISPFLGCEITESTINYNQTGSSSEAGIRGGMNWVFNQVPESLVNGGTSPINFNYGRANSNFEANKRYKINPALFDFSFGFPMQDHGNHGNTSMLYGLDRRQFFNVVNGTDLGVARFMIQQNELPQARAIPIRTLYAQILEAMPGHSAYRDSWHMHRDLDKAVGGYMFAMLTGKCSLGDEPIDSTSGAWREWMSHKIGYETAWSVMYLDANPPCGASVLPVELVDFIVESKGNTAAVLKWATASEDQNSGFYIERRTRDSDWKDMGFVAGQGVSTVQNDYQFEDEGIESGLYYYRLRQVDLDDNYSYSPIKSITITSKDYPFEINAYPNPVNGESLTVSISSFIERQGEAQLIDVLGRVVRQQSFSESNFTINTDGLSPGTYWLTIRMDKDAWEKKIIVR